MPAQIAPSPRRGRPGHVTRALILVAGLLAAGLAPAPVHAQTGVMLDGTNDYVTFGAAPSLGSTTFTLELWFKRTAAGATTSTGTGGITAVPLLTKGRGEADGDSRDMNWFLGIRGTDNVLVADYEEGTGQTSVGLNHPVAGVTPIRLNTWYHAAATFDGTTWWLYLNGVLEQTLVVGANRLPQGASIQHAALGTALTSTGVAAGYFAGVIDEARVWNHARTAGEIAGALPQEIASAPGLLGRWGLNEGSGTTATNSAGVANGTLTNGPVWFGGSPFALANGLSFTGTNGYVTFGTAAALGLPQFTIETWFRRDGPGTTANTGTGGGYAVPLVTKGVGEAEASTVDMNWFLGIRDSDDVLFADFEEGAAGASPGLNHPVAGVTPIVLGQWYHAAATYDGTTWRLYLNGALENTVVVGQPPQSASIQHAGLATALNSTGVASGFFAGVLDEARVWDHARSAAEIVAAINTPLTAPVAGLVARYGLDEGAGSAVASSAGTSLPGTLTGTGWSWSAGAPFDMAPPTPPAAPTGLTATALTHSGIRLTWTDAANNETAFEVERSLDGAGGPFLPRATLAANAQSYDDAGLSASTEACYRVRATNPSGASDWTDVACATTLAPTNTALLLGGTDAYATFGAAPGLGTEQFTVETWFRRDATGVATSTGNGGVTAIPLVTKGVAESDGSVVDMNWFLGIRQSDGVLVADFEEGATGASPGLNHPVAGVTPTVIGQWHHAAVTYDGTWRLYLDGVLETTLAVGQPPQAASTQHAALGSALKSDGAPLGFFAGALDEARVWNYARTEAQIQGTANAQLGAYEPGLLARWALDEGSGTAVQASAGTAIHGTIAGAAFAWGAGAPFDLSFNHAPVPPALVGPADAATGVARPPSLEVTVSDPDDDPVTVRWYGRPTAQGAGPDFTLVHLPDTQYYTSETNGGSNQMFKAQTQWVVAQRAARNIAYVLHVGDLSENGDNAATPIQWVRADSAFATLEDPVATGLPDGIPCGIILGNHDQAPSGDADGTTNYYNQFFGNARFAGRSYDGGAYGANRDNWYELFSAGGLDFIVIGLEYDSSPDAAVLAWADGLLAAHPDRRAIVGVHNLIGTGNPATFSTQGLAVYNALKARPNLMLLLGGHNPGEGRRSDTWNGNTVHTLLADYQSRANGGSGWLRYLEFSPAQNVIRVRTYSPWLGQSEADADSSSQFTLSVPLASSEPFTLLATQEGVPSGSSVSAPWDGLAAETGYEWYVTVGDGAATVTGPTWRFTTAPETPVAVSDPSIGEFTLWPVAPNPVRESSARIAFDLPREAPVRLTLVDVRGRVVATLVDGVRPAGRHAIPWDGRLATGRAPAGLYFVHFHVAGRSFTRRLVVTG